MLFTLNLLSDFFIRFTQKKDQEVLFFSFLRKNLFWGNLIFSSHFLIFDWVSSKSSQATVTIGSLKSQDMISQVNVYVADIVLRYYVVFVYQGQYST